MSANHRANRIFDENETMQEIYRVSQVEIDAVNFDIEEYVKQGYVALATDTGIVKWENILGILPNSDTESLEFRRNRILKRLSSPLPFTETALRESFDYILGVDGWDYYLDSDNGLLDIYSLNPGKNWLTELSSILHNMTPAHILWIIHIYNRNWQSVLDDYVTWQKALTTEKTWNDVLEGS